MVYDRREGEMEIENYYSKIYMFTQLSCHLHNCKKRSNVCEGTCVSVRIGPGTREGCGNWEAQTKRDVSMATAR